MILDRKLLLDFYDWSQYVLGSDVILKGTELWKWSKAMIKE